MVTNSWLWIALIAFIVFCCLLMLFMGRGHKSKHDAANEEDRNSDK